MAVLAVAALGAWAAPVGYAGVGWAIGSIIGQSLFAEDISSTSEGPRLDTLKVQSSSYGRDISNVYGSVRIAGNIIWSNGIDETRHEETTTQGGKGGPDISQTSISYTYSSSFAVGLCSGEISGISRIWADGILIYDFSSSATAEAIFSSTQLTDDISIYTGSETQTADPLIESIEGVGNVPGFRGMAYIVFENYQLANHGNRIPNITAEIIESSTIAYAGPTMTSRPVYADSFYSSTTDGVIRYWSNGEFTTGATLTVPGTIWSLSGAKVGDDSVSFTNPNSGNIIYYNAPVRNSSMHTGYIQQSGKNKACVLPGTLLYLPDGREIEHTLPSPYDKDITTSVYYGGAVYAILGSPQNETATLLKFNSTVDSINGKAVAEYTANDSIQDVYVNGDGVYIIQGETSGVDILKLDYDLNLIDEWTVSPAPWGGLYVDDDIAIVGGGTSSTYRVYRLNSDGTSTILESGAASGTGDSTHPIVVGSMLLCRNQFITTGLITKSTVTLSSIVSDVCIDAGLVAGDIDVTDLTDSVDGYVSNQETTARGLIEPLQQAYLFDAIESDNKLVFVKRGNGDTISVDSNDLGATDGSHKDKLSRRRINELELPSKLSIVHINPATDYQENVESSSRLITDSVNARTLSMPLVISATKAAQISDILLRISWVERDQYEGFLPFEYLKANPSDIITTTINGTSHSILLKEISYQLPGIIQFRGVSEDSAQYTSNAVGATGGFSSQSVSITGPTNIEYLDIPLLRDQDNSNGYYIAASGYLSGWSAANIYKSTDDGDTWSNLTTITTSSTMGAATNALANGIYSIIDYSKTVNIRLSNGTLSSSTEANILNGTNACLLGSEVLHFITATLESDGSYTLSGLLRGRKGTEWAMSTHIAGDRFVLLSETSQITISQDVDEIGVLSDYKAVTIGSTLQGTSSESFTNNAVRLKPLSPVHIAGSRDASDNLTITWIRRTRIGGAWRDYVNASLGEDSESYEVDIMSGAAVLRTISITSATASYTAAQQTADGLTPGDPVEVNIYQLSATVGRGYAGNATI